MVEDHWSQHGGGPLVSAWWRTIGLSMVEDHWSQHGGGPLVSAWWRTIGLSMVEDHWSHHGGGPRRSCVGVPAMLDGPNGST